MPQGDRALRGTGRKLPICHTAWCAGVSVHEALPKTDIERRAPRLHSTALGTAKSPANRHDEILRKGPRCGCAARAQRRKTLPRSVSLPACWQSGNRVGSQEAAARKQGRHLSAFIAEGSMISVSRRSNSIKHAPPQVVAMCLAPARRSMQCCLRWSRAARSCCHCTCAEACWPQ